MKDRTELLARRRLLHTNQTMIARDLRAIPFYDQESRLALMLKKQRGGNAREIAQINSALRALEQWRV